MPRAALNLVRKQLGLAGLAGLLLLVAVVALDTWGLRPLQARSEAVDSRLARASALERASDARDARDAAPASKLASLYRYLDTGHKPTDWLQKLELLARSSGVVLRTADYRLQQAGSRLERYEITLPLEGGYSQVRGFLEKALQEIPVLSLDQISFKRRQAGEAQVQAEAKLTLHLLSEGAR